MYRTERVHLLVSALGFATLVVSLAGDLATAVSAAVLVSFAALLVARLVSGDPQRRALAAVTLLLLGLVAVSSLLNLPRGIAITLWVGFLALYAWTFFRPARA